MFILLSLQEQHSVFSVKGTLRQKCPYLEFFWSVFSRIRTEYGDFASKSLYSVVMWENTDQKNSEYGHFLHSGNGNSFMVISSFMAKTVQSIITVRIVTIRSGSLRYRKGCHK